MANIVQKEFALCVACGLGNWQAANVVGYRNKHCARLRRSKGVVEELGRIRSDMIEKTSFTKEFMLEKLFGLMGKMESVRFAAESLEPKEQREHIKMALDIAKEINKMLGHYTSQGAAQEKGENTRSDLITLIEKVENRCKGINDQESKVVVVQNVE